MKFFVIKLFIVVCILQCSPLRAEDDKARRDLVTVPSVDIQKYAGLWYEIALIPNRFQKKCSCNTTAEYSLREDGKIDVINRCVKKNGEVVIAKGIAKIADPETNAKLKVSFVRILGLSLFWGDYWIIGLAEDYQWAVVGTPSRKYGWILARAPKLEKDMLEHIYQLLREQGYDPSKFVRSMQ